MIPRKVIKKKKKVIVIKVLQMLLSFKTTNMFL